MKACRCLGGACWQSQQGGPPHLIHRADEQLEEQQATQHRVHATGEPKGLKDGRCGTDLGRGRREGGWVGGGCGEARHRPGAEQRGGREWRAVHSDSRTCGIAHEHPGMQPAQPPSPRPRTSVNRVSCANDTSCWAASSLGRWECDQCPSSCASTATTCGKWMEQHGIMGSSLRGWGGAIRASGGS